MLFFKFKMQIVLKQSKDNKRDQAKKYAYKINLEIQTSILIYILYSTIKIFYLNNFKNLIYEIYCLI